LVVAVVILNGRLPTSLLAAVPGTSQLVLGVLVPQTAALRDSFCARFGKELRLSDGYRDFDAQVRVKADKGKWAATPGTSNHGLGRAIDFGSGVNVEDSAEYAWMKGHAPDFGWFHPRWAEDGNPSNGQQEPWHWESAALPTSDPAWSAAGLPADPELPGLTPPEDDMYTENDRARDDAMYGWLQGIHPQVVTHLPQIKAQMDALQVADTRSRIGNLQYAVGLLLARDPATVSAEDIAAAIPLDLARAVASELARRLGP
jgi:hypothetical protein